MRNGKFGITSASDGSNWDAIAAQYSVGRVSAIRLANEEAVKPLSALNSNFGE
jgi:type II secretory pathway component PulL